MGLSSRHFPIPVRLLAGASGLLLLSACGIYSFKGNLPPHIKSISVAPIENQTAEFAVTDLANQLLSEFFLAENVLRVTSEENAHSSLRVVVTKVTDQPFTYTVGERVEEWRLDIRAQVVWYDLIRNAPFFEKTLTAFGIYRPGGDIGSDEIDNDNDGVVDEEDEFGDPREFAIRTAILKISQDILSEVTSTW